MRIQNLYISSVWVAFLALGAVSEINYQSLASNVPNAIEETNSASNSDLTRSIDFSGKEVQPADQASGPAADRSADRQTRVTRHYVKTMVAEN